MGYEIAVLALIPIAVFYRRRKIERELLKQYMMSAFFMVYISISLLFVFTVFPFVFQYGAPIHAMNYLNPLYRIHIQLKIIKYGIISLQSVIAEDVEYWGASLVIYGLYGLTTAMLCRRKKAFAIICLTSAGVQVWHLLWSLAMGGLGNYKSVDSEDFLLFILFGSLGILFYSALVKLTGRFADSNRVLNWLYHTLTVHRTGDSKKTETGGEQLAFNPNKGA